MILPYLLTRWAEPRENALRQAGIHHPRAARYFFAVQAALGTGLVSTLVYCSLVFGIPGFMLWFLGLPALAAGMLIPRFWLQARRRRRRQAIRRALPDMMDLLVLCVEAGLSLEQALQRVSQEIRPYSAELAQELGIVSVELNAGSGRVRTLRRLALRVELEPVDGLVSLLVQAERFGTRISDALVAQAEQVRKEQRRAVEKAASLIGLKLLFPLVFCIFPGLLVVLVGPAFIGIYRALQV